MRIALIVAICGLAVVMTGCAGAGMYGAPIVPAPGLFFAQVSAPITTEFHDTAVVMKKGSATAENILGLIATGDCSLQAAAMSVGLKKINYADYTFYNILGIYSKFTVNVYGE